MPLLSGRGHPFDGPKELFIMFSPAALNGRLVQKKIENILEGTNVLVKLR